jgi:hypothetical protein
MRILCRYVLVVVALAAGSVLLAACGGDGQKPALDNYFQQLEDIKQTYSARAEAMSEEALAIQEDLEAYKEYFGDMQDLFDEALNEMKGLDPPPEARDAHDEWIAAQSELQAASYDLGDRVADTESLSELVEIFQGLQGMELEPPSGRVREACRELQRIAGENGIDVDLRCGEDM